MKMIAGALALNFDSFRAVPFESAELSFSNGPALRVRHQPQSPDYKIHVQYGDCQADLLSDKNTGSYTPEQQNSVNLFRFKAKQALDSIDYDFLTIERSLTAEVQDDDSIEFLSGRVVKRRKRTSLSDKISNFLRDAQVNYRRFFQAEDLELLPRILSRFENSESLFRYEDMLSRLNFIKGRNEVALSFGLQTNDADVAVLSELLYNPQYQADSRALTLIDSYLEMHENISKSRQLIADRLVEFERIMSEFLVGKTIKVNARDGLVISSIKGKLKESDLSSGEYHFLYMMVSALLCQRAGTILAIDEPELSLHVKWQRDLVKALSRCARGASPIFFLATHSTVISAQYAHKVQRLSAID